ncbi:hypothetical protein GQR58_007175 [Nymphon striatum]|nr:hypothetical protein GQR58_007175 [Nymphon striatum]
MKTCLLLFIGAALIGSGRAFNLCHCALNLMNDDGSAFGQIIGTIDVALRDCSIQSHLQCSEVCVHAASKFTHDGEWRSVDPASKRPIGDIVCSHEKTKTFTNKYAGSYFRVCEKQWYNTGFKSVKPISCTNGVVQNESWVLHKETKVLIHIWKEDNIQKQFGELNVPQQICADRCFKKMLNLCDTLLMGDRNCRIGEHLENNQIPPKRSLDKNINSTVTDHKPLQAIFDFKKGLPSCGITARLQRYAMRLAMFDYSVEHRSGSRNSNADALSRAPVDQAPVVVDECELFNISCIQSLPLDERCVAEETEKDPESNSLAERAVRNPRW